SHRNEACNLSRHVALSLNVSFAQLFNRGLRADRGVIHLLESIGASFGTEHWQNLDVPVVVLVDRLPVAEGLRGMQAAGRGVQVEVEFFRDSAHPLKRSPQKSAEVDPQPWFVQACALEGGFVVARQNPCLIRDSGRIGTERYIIAAGFDHAESLSLLLLNDIAEHAAFLGREIFTPSA